MPPQASVPSTHEPGPESPGCCERPAPRGPRPRLQQKNLSSVVGGLAEAASGPLGPAHRCLVSWRQCPYLRVYVALRDQMPFIGPAVRVADAQSAHVVQRPLRRSSFSRHPQPGDVALIDVFEVHDRARVWTEAME